MLPVPRSLHYVKVFERKSLSISLCPTPPSPATNVVPQPCPCPPQPVPTNSNASTATTTTFRQAVCYVNPHFEKISTRRNTRPNYGHVPGRQRIGGREPWPTLHFYSNYAGRLVLGAGDHDFFNTETYPLESIREFEAISGAWKQLLANLLKKGLEEGAVGKSLFPKIMTFPDNFSEFPYLWMVFLYL